MSVMSVALRDDTDVVLARRRARDLARRLGLDVADQVRFATAVPEIARNAVQYAGGGDVEFAVEAEPTPRLYATISDSGPGIPDIEAVLKRQVPTKTGQGRGLAGAQRLMECCEVQSRPGQGTRVSLSRQLAPGASFDLPQVQAWRAEWAAIPAEPLQMELREQNRELLTALQVVHSRELELTQLNREMDETNRGVLALHAELNSKALELERRSEELAALNGELEAFSYSVSHDLRAPLRSIDAYAALLQEEAVHLDATGVQNLQRIRSAAQRMATMIEDLLSLARVVRSPLQTSRVDLSALARQVGEELEAAQPLPSPSFTVQDGVCGDGDATLLRLVVQNLISNAWKFTAKTARGKVAFGATPDARGQLVFWVRDNGAGFDMQFADKLFGAFQRLHAASDFPGTGVGLATVQRIVRRHGGRVWAESVPGRGATFSFTLSPARVEKENAYAGASAGQ